MSNPIKVQLVIPNISEYVGVARLTVSGVASRLKFTHEEIEDIKIAVSEACTNAVQYAYPEASGDIVIDFDCYKDKLEITITDKGRGFNIDDKPSTQSEDPNKIGLGLGIVFMKSLMDDVVFKTEIGKGTTVKLVKKVLEKQEV